MLESWGSDTTVINYTVSLRLCSFKQSYRYHPTLSALQDILIFLLRFKLVLATVVKVIIVLFILLVCMILFCFSVCVYVWLNEWNPQDQIEPCVN